jgi:hypothetical protein
MNASNFDRFTRAFARPASRRGVLAVAGGFLALRRSESDAAQLSPDSCASTGEVCTLLYGCCSGLSCATSAINPSYGVCIPGDGGTVSTGTALVVPFDEGDSTAAQPTVDDTSTSTTTDPQAEREQQIAERKARRDTHRNKIDLRKDQQQDKKEDQQDKRELARGPELEFRLTLEGDVDSLKVFNRDNQTVVLNKIGSILTTSEETKLTTPVQLSDGESYLFISGKLSDQGTSRFEWASRRVCDTTGDGFVVTAAFSSNSDNFDYEILCDGPSIVLFDHPDKKNKGNNGNNTNGKNRKRQGNKGRGNKNHKNG